MGINRYRTTYRNWPYLILNVRKKDLPTDKKITVITKTGNTITLWGLQFHLLDSLAKKGTPIDKALYYVIQNKIPFKESLITIEGWLTDGNINNGNIFDVFINEDYKFLDVKDKDVIDIGASIGDSPIYFALSGAKRVIALEPYPYSYNLAKKNVETNDLTKKIEILNAGYGKDDDVFVDPYKVSLDYAQFQPAQNGIKIKLYSLKSLIELFKITDAVLKMDCEGCEYSLITEDTDSIRKFSHIQIEYHYGYSELKDKLENSGFEVKWTKPNKFYDPRDKINHNMELGYIYAKRK